VYDYGNYSTKKKRKRTRRSEKRSGKTFFDFGGGLEDITDYDDDYYPSTDSRKNEYDWLIEKFVDEDMSPEELMIVAEQYLNPDSQYDKYFYDYLMEKAMEKYDL
jgi:hypothetical protein